MILGYLVFGVFILLALVVSFWILVPTFLEKPKFSIAFSSGSIQVRNYSPMVAAQINTIGERYDGLRAGFIPLARYIGAKDRDGTKISMTAPVMQQMDTQKRIWTVSFFMPSKYSIDQLPAASDSRIRLNTLPPQQMATISFNGVANKDLLTKKLLELKEWIENSEFSISGNSEPIFAYYNDPSTPGILRKNEIMLPVSKIVK